MPAPTTTSRRPRRGPLRSPLAAAPRSAPPPIDPPAHSGRPAPCAAVPEPRSVTLEEFRDYLRTVTNRDGRPYEEATICAYLYPAKALDRWMTERGLDGDFTTVDTGLLNRYFRDYYRARGQGGTHTQQRNLIQLFNFLQREYGHPSPYVAGLNRYAEPKGRPKTLSAAFIDDLLEVTGGGRPVTSRTPATTPLSGSCRSWSVATGRSRPRILPPFCATKWSRARTPNPRANEHSVWRLQ
jgi:hypothetical protein